MMRLRMIPTLLPATLLIALGLALTSCAATAPRPTAAGGLVHVVAFWLKPGAPSDAVERLRRFYLTRVAREVPGVEDVRVGPPRPSERAVVDDSFSCMSVVRFADAAAEVAWQTHPVHDALRAEFEPLFDRVVVYDLLEAP